MRPKVSETAHQVRETRAQPAFDRRFWISDFPVLERGYEPASAILRAAGGAVNMAYPGYKFVVEPLGPELPDDAAGGTLDSFPDFAMPLANPIDTAAEALAQAMSELAATGLGDEFGLSNGAFDSLANIMLLDPANEADWLVPYLRGGEYSGAVLIDSETGVLEQATWREGLDDFDFTLAQLVDRYTDFYNGVLPENNPVNVPEPAACVLLVLALALTARRRRR